MRLLKVSSVDSTGRSLELESFIGSHIPSYAILSHTWTKDEVLFDDVKGGTAGARTAYPKVKEAAKRADHDGLEYVWIDTCCIDKSSSAELQEAINSMFAWYQRAEVCYAHLADVCGTNEGRTGGKRAHEQDMKASRWFRRGWTLQELLAPKRIAFFSQQWKNIGALQRNVETYSYQHDFSCIETVSQASGIEECFLRSIDNASIATRMSWASARETTREEDIAYCLMGLFDVSMPLLYGEGDKAFLRLQEEIMRQTDDNTLFAWEAEEDSGKPHGLLADHPSCFKRFRDARRTPQFRDVPPHSMTNQGLHIQLPLKPLMEDMYIAILDCGNTQSFGERAHWYGVYVKRLPTRRNQFARILCDQTYALGKDTEMPATETLFVSQTPDSSFGPRFRPHVRLRGDDHTLDNFRIVTLAGRQPGFWRLNVLPDFQRWDALSKTILKFSSTDPKDNRIALQIEHLASSERLMVVLGWLSCGLVGFDAIVVDQLTFESHRYWEPKTWRRGDHRERLIPVGGQHLVAGTFRVSADVTNVSGTASSADTPYETKVTDKHYTVLLHIRSVVEANTQALAASHPPKFEPSFDQTLPKGHDHSRSQPEGVQDLIPVAIGEAVSRMPSVVVDFAPKSL